MKTLILILLFSITYNSYADISVITGHGFVLNSEDREILIDFSRVNKDEILDILREEKWDNSTLNSNILNNYINESLPDELSTKRKILIDIDLIESIKLKDHKIFSENGF